jgi:hypothetical protein
MEWYATRVGSNLASQTLNFPQAKHSSLFSDEEKNEFYSIGTRTTRRRRSLYMLMIDNNA